MLINMMKYDANDSIMCYNVEYIMSAQILICAQYFYVSISCIFMMHLTSRSITCAASEVVLTNAFTS